MYSRALAMLVLLGCALPAAAQTFHDHVARAEALLQANEAAQALEAFRELQVEYPNAPEVVLGMGAAQYRQAELALALGHHDQARTHFTEAQDTFQRLFSAEQAVVRRHAAFNYANAVAKQAKAYDTDHERTELITALRRAITAFEAVQQDFPEDDDVQQNLDHVRYVLKRLLQHPPEQQVFMLQVRTELENKDAIAEEFRVKLVDREDAPGTAPEAGGEVHHD